MSIIHIADDKQGNIIDFITGRNIIDDEHKKSLENTLETYQFRTFADKRFSEFLEKRNRIIIADEDGTLREFVIAEAIKYKDREGHKQQIFSRASYLELKKASILYPNVFTGSASQHAGRALNNTVWRVGIIESPASRQIQLTIENHTNPYTFLKRIAREFGLELRFRIEHDGNRITGRYVDLLERRGEWRGRLVEFGKDLDGIRRIEKQDIVTALLGLGPEDEDGNRLEVLVEDEEALQRWGTLDDEGNLNHLIEPYQIQSDRTEMTEEEARQYTRTALNKRIDTQISYETTIIDLENVPGMQNKKIRFGDTIRIKDTKFNPPLYLEARIFEQTRSIKSQAKKDIKLGDFVEFTEEEVHSEFEQLRKEIRSRVTRYEMAEYTYDKLTIDDKDETVFTEGKTFAEAVGVDAKEYADTQDGHLQTGLEGYADGRASEAQQAAEAVAIAQAELAETQAKAHADGIVSAEEARAIADAEAKLQEAKEHADSVSVQEAESALSQAKIYAVAQEVYDIQMQNIADDLSDRAPIEYVDGQFQVIDGRLDDFDVELEEKADGSNVYTISQVDNMINNTVSVTQYTEDINGIITDLESQGTRIGQNETAIGLKADSSYVDTIEQELTTQIGNVEVKADAVEISVSEVRADLDGLEIGGRNLLLNSQTVQESDSSSGALDNISYDFSNNLIEGEYYTFSFLSRTSNGTDKFYIWIREGNTTKQAFIRSGDAVSAPEDYKLFTFTIRADEEGAEGTRITITNRTQNVSDNTGILYVKEAQLERGNKATDWSPAPEDMATSAQVTALDASITTLAGEVSLKASQSDLDTLTGEVSTLESELSVLPGQIAAKVDDGEARSIFLQEASSFTFSADQINFDGHVFGDNATFTGTMTAGRIEGVDIEGSNIIVHTSSGYAVTGIDHRGFFAFDMEKDTYVSISDGEIRSEPFSSPQGLDNTRITMNSTGLSVQSYNNDPAHPYFDVGYFDSFVLDGRSIKSEAQITFDANLGVTIYESNWDITFESRGYSVFREGVSFEQNMYAELFGTTRRMFLDVDRNIALSTRNSGSSATIYAPRGQSNMFEVRSHNGSWGSYSNEFWINQNGNLYNPATYDTTSSNSANVRIGKGTYRFLRATSARKYKTDIQRADHIDPYKLLDLKPSSWLDKREYEENGGSPKGLRRYYGIIADEMEEIGLSEYVEYGGYGEVENIVERAWTLTLPILSDHESKLNRLETENQLLKNEIKILKERIA